MTIGTILSKKNRALLRELVVTDFKLRYQGSVLGYAWSLLRPLLIFLILYVVFVKFLKLGAGVPHYPVYLLFGIVVWNFFSEMTSMSLGSIVGRGDLIRKIRIPRWIIVISSSISALINFLLNLLVVAVFVAANHVHLTGLAWWLPLILVEVYLLALGVSLFLAAAFVRFRDVGYIWEVVLQAMFYLTPIIYPVSRITNVTFQKLLFLNPVAQAIQDARYTTITPVSITMRHVYGGFGYEWIAFGMVAGILLLGIMFFKREAKYFAENI